MRSLSYISGDICNPLAFRARMLLLIVSFAFIACISGCGGSNATASTVPVAGAIEVLGQPLNRKSVWELRRKIAWVPQEKRAQE